MLNYVDLGLGSEGADTLRQLLHAVHGSNVDKDEYSGQRLAIAFPWLQPISRDSHGRVLHSGSPGAVLRLFGRDSMLKEFLDSSVPARLQRLGVTKASTVLPVPHVLNSVRFVRDRKFEKHHKNGSYVRYGGNLRKNAHKGVDEFSVCMPSKTTRQQMYLNIRQEKSEGPWVLQSISSYGLCKDGTSLPDF